VSISKCSFRQCYFLEITISLCGYLALTLTHRMYVCWNMIQLPICKLQSAFCIVSKGLPVWGGFVDLIAAFHWSKIAPCPMSLSNPSYNPVFIPCQIIGIMFQVVTVVFLHFLQISPQMWCNVIYGASDLVSFCRLPSIHQDLHASYIAFSERSLLDLKTP